MSFSQNHGYSALRRVSSPWLMLPPSFEEGGGNMSYNFYSLAENRVVSLKKMSNLESDSPKDDAVIVGSSHGWLALYNRGDRGLFLSNPITGENVRLPPIETLDTFNQSIFSHEEKYCVVKKVILSSPPHQQDCRAIIFFDDRKLAVCSPGRSSKWTSTIEWYYYPHEDVVYSTTHKLFFSLKDSGSEPYDLNGWDATNPSSPKDQDDLDDDDLHEWPMTFRYKETDDEDWYPYDRSKLDSELLELYGSWPMRHLVHVEHTGQLLHVKRYFVEQMAPDGSPIKDRRYPRVCPHKTVVFHVYVIDPRQRYLRYMEDSLDGLALFVGLNHSFALRAADYPELKPDSIYFTDSLALTRPTAFDDDNLYGGHDIGIFDYKNKTISPCYYPCDHRSFKKIYPSPLWFTPSPH